MKNWKDLPQELKERVVTHLTPDTRYAFSVCSSLENQLVKDVKLNKIKEMTIDISLEKWSIYTCGAAEYDTDLSHFKSFEELQTAVLNKMKEIKSIKELSINGKGKDRTQYIKLLTDEDREYCRLRKVEELHINTDNHDELVAILKQVEPIYLRKLEVFTSYTEEDLFDMPQIVNADEEVHFAVDDNGISEEQLMNLNARCLKLNNLFFSVNDYIKKCIREANKKISQFEFSSCDDYKFVRDSLDDWIWNVRKDKDPNEPLVINTPYPHLKLEVKPQGFFSFGLTGEIVFKSESFASSFLTNELYLLRIIERLDINFDDVQTIRVVRKHQPKKYYRFEGADKAKAQRKVNEILKNTDFIKDFKIKNGAGLSFQARKNKLMVRKLDVSAGNGMRMLGRIMDDARFDKKIECLIKNIEPRYLKELSLWGGFENKKIYDLPAIIQAPNLEIGSSFLHDDQLVKIEAETLKIYVSIENFCLTATGLNQYLKKCLHYLNDKNYNFCIGGAPATLLEEEGIFKDLDVTKSAGYANETNFVINSDHPEYDLFGSFGGNMFSVKRR